VGHELWCLAGRVTDGHTVSPQSDCYVIPEPGLVLSLLALAVLLYFLKLRREKFYG
jgi:hypothetical protein